MHWTDTVGTPPDFDTGFDRWITMSDWLDTLSESDRERFEWENEAVTRRTTGGPSTRRRESYWGHYVATQTIKFMTKCRRQARPFLCWSSFWEPHPPFYPPADLYAVANACDVSVPPIDDSPAEVHPLIASKRKEWEHLTAVERRQMICGYYGLIALVDSFVGQVIKHLESTGDLENTIIVFTSDHGEQLGEHGMFLKFVMREGSLRVPFWIIAPGVAPSEYEGIVEHVDMFPTLCELTGIRLGRSVSGTSLTPLLDGNEKNRVAEIHGGGGSERYALSQIRDQHMVRNMTWKLNVYGGVPAELFNIRKDPGEVDNLVSDPEYADMVTTMLREIRRKGVNLSEWGTGTPNGA